MHEVAESTPLDTKFVSYFELKESVDSSFSLGRRVRNLLNEHQKLTNEYNQHRELILKARDGDIAKSNCQTIV